ncbi:MAG: cell division protein FtsQ/DivIB, partial [Minisyncoccia bacterium]
FFKIDMMGIVMKSRKPSSKTKKESRRWRKKTLITLVLCCVIFVNFIWIMRHERFAVTEIEVHGTQTILDVDIQEMTSNALNKNMLFLLPRSNMFILNTSRIENLIKNSFPKIYNADVSLKKNKKLVIQIEEREPHSLWCLNIDYDSDFDEQCFFADQRGYIYSSAPYFSDGVFEKIYTNQELVIGTQVMDKSGFADFFEFVELLGIHYGIVMNRVLFNQDNQIQIYINKILETDLLQGPYIIYHQGTDYELLDRNLGLMLGQKEFKKEFKKNASKLEFIDLRIGDQIRYKFTPIEPLDPTSDSKPDSDILPKLINQ